MEDSYEGVKYDDEMRDEGITCSQVVQRQVEILDEYLARGLGLLSLGAEAPRNVLSDRSSTATTDEMGSGRAADASSYRDNSIVISGGEDEARVNSECLQRQIRQLVRGR